MRVIITYENSSGQVTIADCLNLYLRHDIAVIIDEGRHVTLSVEPRRKKEKAPRQLHTAKGTIRK